MLPYAHVNGCLCAPPGEGCEGRERSEAVRNEVEYGSDSVPRKQPDPAAERSPAERSSGGTPKK
ncbi:MAG: hypothetical protein NZM35_11045 [Chitinophagales bacterium]|nr:hypothetical protein [Chitinophagales bacterium]MDW8419865.1 hypothetical protein [Chitinophagales bacterium]